MKNAITVISNVLSVVSMIALLAIGAFCIYDLIAFSASPFAGSIDLWLAMRIYVKLLFAFSITGMVISGINFACLPESRTNAFKIFSFVLFVVGFIGAIVLFYFSHNF